MPYKCLYDVADDDVYYYFYVPTKIMRWMNQSVRRQRHLRMIVIVGKILCCMAFWTDEIHCDPDCIPDLGSRLWFIIVLRVVLSLMYVCTLVRAFLSTSAKEVMFFTLFVCLLAGLCKNCLTDFHKIRWKGGTSAIEETVRLWW